MARSNLNRFLGGSPLPVVLRLGALSVIVGIILSALNLHPRRLVQYVFNMFERIYYMGFDAIHWAIEYFFLGALIVIPVWFVIRLIKMGERDSDIDS